MDALAVYLDSLSIATEEVVVDRDLNDTKFQMRMKQIGRAFMNIINSIIKMVNYVLTKFKNFFMEANKQINASRSTVSIVDTYNHVGHIMKASEIIDEYFGLLTKLRATDHEINKSTSMVDSLKQRTKEGVLGRGNRESQRELLENVHYYFGKADECKESLDEILEDIKREIPVNNPRRYSMDFIKKEINITLTAKIKMLEDLKKQLDITKKMYDDRSFMYKKWHGEDIRRNQGILNHTTSLIRQTEEFRSIYIKMLAQADGINIPDEE